MSEGKKRGRKPSAQTKLANSLKEKEVKEYSIPAGSIHVCTCCGKSAKKDNLEKMFYISYSPFHEKNGRVPLCKECIIKMSTVRGELVPDMFVEVVRALDKPFLKKVLDSSINQVVTESKEEEKMDIEKAIKTKADSVIGLYMRTISMPQYKQLTWLDGDKRYSENRLTDSIESTELEHISVDDLLYKWGENYTDQEFEFLENRYGALVSMANVEFESDIMMLKQICLEELDLRNIRRKNGDTSKKLESIQKLMATANIRPTDIKNANSDLLNDSYGKWISVIENYEPCEFFADKSLYDDYDGIKKYFTDWVLRPLKNLLAGQRDFNVED